MSADGPQLARQPHDRRRSWASCSCACSLAGVYLTYSIFTKKFTDYDEVTLQTSTIGLQLPERADVKIRGVIVGEVLDFEANGAGDGADVTLGIFPSELDTIPANVTGSIVPKTLFGEKYVSLVVPDEPDADHIEAGATIERTVVSTEVEQVLSDLYPLLRTVQPAADQPDPQRPRDRARRAAATSSATTSRPSTAT